MKFSAIILAGGKGLRFGGYKQFLKIFDIPLYEFSIKAFEDLVDEIILVIPEGFYLDLKNVKIVYGGQTRANSSYNGIINSSGDFVLIHDASRPNVSKELILRIKEELLKGNNAVVPFIEVRDTIRDKFGNELNRENLMLIQTPQGFKKHLIKIAYEKAFESNINGTDDAFYYKTFISNDIKYINGDFENFKITFRDDIKILERFFMKNIKVGFGYDIHPLVENRKLIIGGVEIPSNFGAFGHSDGDALIHAIIDSLSGIILNKSIGEIFAENEKNKDAYSLNLLKEFSSSLKGYKIISIDAVIILKEPKLTPYIDKMKENISQVLKLNKDSISIKPKSGNNLKNEFIECYVVSTVLL
jgi:2-C-methyl-D-erythritol 4-phosphate cytidylyltransferase/2-C-methyl-D-erythritol 2,4-cyclodiphosphate synthase